MSKIATGHGRFEGKDNFLPEYVGYVVEQEIAPVKEDLKKTKGTLTQHMEDKNNPHTVTKAQVGLGNADNTADMDKPVSKAVKAELDKKADKTTVKEELGKKADKQNADGGFVGGNGATVTAGGAIGSYAHTESGGAVGSEANSISGGAVGGGAFAGAGGGAIGLCAKTLGDQGGFAGGEGAEALGMPNGCGGAAAGYHALVEGAGGAVGYCASAGNGFAGGKNARAVDDANNGIDAIQLGTGTNSVPKTLQVYGYRLMDADGHVPNERLGETYTRIENAEQKAETAANAATEATATANAAAEEAEHATGAAILARDMAEASAGKAAAAAAAANAAAEGIDEKIAGKADKQTATGGFAGGEGATATYGGAVGEYAFAEGGGAIGSDSRTDNGGAVGANAYSTFGGAAGANANTNHGGAVGAAAKSDFGGAVGSDTLTGNGFAGGYNAKTIGEDGYGIDAIQLGTGTNNTPKTLQIYDYQLMDAAGNIPAERLNNAIGKPGTGDRAEKFNRADDASGAASHAEGNRTTAAGTAAHAEGSSTKAAGDSSHAEGSATRANEEYSHAEGAATIAGVFGSKITAVDKENSTLTLEDGSTALKSVGKVSIYSPNTGGYASWKECDAFSSDATHIMLTPWPKTNPEVGDYVISESDASWGVSLLKDIVHMSCHAEGRATRAIGVASHAEGDGSVAVNDASHAEGMVTLANGASSHAEGDSTIAQGEEAHAEGMNSMAIGAVTHAEGDKSAAIGNTSHAEGGSSVTGVRGTKILAADYENKKLTLETVEGLNFRDKIAIFHPSNYRLQSYEKCEIMGVDTNTNQIHIPAWVDCSIFPMQMYVTVPAKPWWGTTDFPLAGQFGHAEGQNCRAHGNVSHAEGSKTAALGIGTHAEGVETIAEGTYSHAEGYMGIATGSRSHAEGSLSRAIGTGSHAEGNQTSSCTSYSHAEGQMTSAGIRGFVAVEWSETDKSLLVGGIGMDFLKLIDNNVITKCSFYDRASKTYYVDYAEIVTLNETGSLLYLDRVPEGLNYAEENICVFFTEAPQCGTEAVNAGVACHAEGVGTIATGAASHAQGKYNLVSSTYAHVVGNGQNKDSRSNAYSLDWDGNGVYAGGLKVHGNQEVATKDNGKGGFVGGAAICISNGAALGKNAQAARGGAIGEDAYTVNGAAIGLKAYAQSNGSAIGGAAYAESGGGAVGSKASVTGRSGGFAGGSEAKVEAAANKMGGGVAIGYNALTEGGGGAIGNGATAGNGFAGGKDAGTLIETTDEKGYAVIDAIQLGTGTNGVEKTLQVYDYQLLDALGNIPKERILQAVEAILTEKGLI